MTLAHRVRPKEGPFVAVKESDGKKKFTKESAATEAKRGRLRVSKTGSELSFLVAEEDEEPFRELQRVDVGRDDLVALRISASSEDSASALTVRLHDLRIRADDLPAAHPPSGGSRRWLVVWVLVIVVGGAAGGSLLWWNRRRQGE